MMSRRVRGQAARHRVEAAREPVTAAYRPGPDTTAHRALPGVPAGSAHWPSCRRASADNTRRDDDVMHENPYYRLLDGAAFASAAPSVGEARRWLRKVLDRHPRRDDAVILLSEAMTNSVIHTRSTAIEVTVHTDVDGRLLITVTDEGSGTIPTAPTRPADDLAESGRGLHLVRVLSARWGFTEEHPRCSLWFVLAPTAPAHPGPPTRDAVPAV